MIYLAFANDRDQYLQMINLERKQITRALQEHNKEGRIQLITEASSTIEDIFHAFHAHDHEITIFHYGGHASGTHLVLEAADGSKSEAQSTGLASLLGSQKQLKLVFLNGCATRDQVEVLINKGVRAVIATSVKIDDGMATEFAEQFYKSLANHSSIREAFDRASAFVKSKYAEASIETYGGSQLVEWMAKPSDDIAWGLYMRNPADNVLDWSIPTEAPAGVEGDKRSNLLKILLIIGAILAIPAAIMTISGYSVKDLLGGGAKADTGSLTVFVHGKKGQADKILTNKGAVRLIYGDSDKTEAIDNEGEVIFTGIPNAYFSNPSNKVQLQLTDLDNEPYTPTVPDSQYALEAGQGIYLEVELAGLDKVYGVVKDARTGQLLDSVRVSIRNAFAITDENGWFELEIPAEMQTQFHTVRASKAGYQLWEQSNIPAQTDREMQLLLKPEE